jgi:phage terminase large subunit-like protein
MKHPIPWWGRGPAPSDRWPGVTIPFNASWSTLRRRWETHGGRYYFDPIKADRAESFFPLFLEHHIGSFAGQPFVLRPDQALLIVRPAFGWRRTADGLRRIRKIFAFCPKGYGKSPLGAGLGIYLARYDGEPAAEVYAVAADRNQARTVHDNAKVMIENSPALLEGCEIVKNAITWPGLYSRYTVLSSDASTAHGLRPHGVIFDELHAQKNRDLFEALRKSMSKRDQPLLVIITHAGDDDEGICYEEYDLAKRVLSGNAADLETTLPVIFEAAKGEHWDDPAIWKRVNPGHGITIRHDDIAEEAREASAEPRKRNDFERYHLNRWTNQATAWILLEWWDACEGPLEDATLETLECCAGLDLAQKWDLAAFVVVFRRYLSDATAIDVAIKDDETGVATTVRVALNYELFLRPYFWIPEDTLRLHERQDGVPYGVWRDAGLVTATEGTVIDYARIYEDITTRIVPKYPKLKEGTIGYDPAFATDLATKLRDLAGLQVVEVLQNYKMISEPAQIVEALIKGHRITHDGHRVLRWNWENIGVKTDDAGRIRPVKPRNPAKRIDGAVAVLLGQRALAIPRPRVPDYEMYFFNPRGVSSRSSDASSDV